LGEKEKEYLNKFDELMRGYEKLTDAKITEVYRQYYQKRMNPLQMKFS